MGKTLVVPRHEAGPHTNGYDSCFARLDGMCPGVGVARWLNSLGDDNDQYDTHTTCGEVRLNWLRGGNHIISAEHELLELRVAKRRLEQQLADVNHRLHKLGE